MLNIEGMDLSAAVRYGMVDTQGQVYGRLMTQAEKVQEAIRIMRQDPRFKNVWLEWDPNLETAVVLPGMGLPAGGIVRLNLYSADIFYSEEGREHVLSMLGMKAKNKETGTNDEG